jgi:hypothetical protein
VFHLSFTTCKEMRTYPGAMDRDARKRDAFLEAVFEGGVYLLPEGTLVRLLSAQ